MAAAIQTALPSWSRRLIAELESSDRHAERLAQGLTPEQLNWRPRPEAWSVGQCLEHLHITNEVYLPPISRALDGGSNLRVEEITPGWFGRWFIQKFIEPSSGTTRVQAPKKIAPGRLVEPSILNSFLRSNQGVRQVVVRASDADVNRIRFKNPFLPLVRFTVGTGFEIFSKHQSRHLAQAERVRQEANFPQ